MLSEREQQFIEYWETHRDKEKKTNRQLLIGLPIGLLFTAPILLSVFSAKFWYKRADMVANTTSPTVLIVAVMIIAVFIAIFYKRHQWEMKEQQYQELKAREGKGTDDAPMQQ
jgi:membrane protein YdbS with pleckstrin-like domain